MEKISLKLSIILNLKYGAPFVSKLFVNVVFNVVVTYPVKCSCNSINQPLLLFTLTSFYCRDATFSTLISFYCRYQTFSTLMSFFLPWCNIFYLHIILLPWCDIFYLDIILPLWSDIFYLEITCILPWCDIFYLWHHFMAWCNIFYLDIILLPWCDIFYLDIIYCSDATFSTLIWFYWHDATYHRTAVMRHFLLWYHFTAVMENMILLPLSQWYVYPRDMCIPVHISLVICVSLQYGCQWNVYPLTPHPSKQVSVFISVVFVNSTNHRQRDYKWFKIMSNTIDKRATVRDKIIATLFLASLLLRGPQCWCKHSFSLLPLSNVIIIHMSLFALNKYNWQNFIQQGITRKVKK